MSQPFMSGRNRRRIAAGALALTAALTLSACTGGGIASGDFSIGAAASSVPYAPDNSGQFMFSAADLDALREASGLDANDERWAEYLLGGVDQDGTVLPLTFILPSVFTYAAAPALPFDLSDVSRLVDMSAPPTSITVYTGNDAVAIPEDFETWQDNIMTDRADEDFTDSNESGTIDPLGRPTRMASANNSIAMSPETGLVADWLAGANAFIDQPGVRAVAAALDKQHVLSTVIYPAPSDLLVPSVVDEHFDLLALGWGMHDDEPRWIVVYRFTSAEAAASSEPGLASAWQAQAESSDGGYSFVETVSDGDTVTAVLAPDATQSGFTLQRMISDSSGLMTSPAE